RCLSDWSSDVCSSDLKGTEVPEFSTTINPSTNGGPTSYAHAVPDILDVENRLFGSNGAAYTYDQANKRVLVDTSANGVKEFTFRSEERRAGKEGSLWG